MGLAAFSFTGRVQALTAQPSVAFWMILLRGALAAGCGLLIAGISHGAAAEEWVKPPLRNATERLIYRFEVASYCGLVSDRAGAGFRRRLARLVVGERLDSRQLSEARAQAWKAARWEWENRGLGGFRRWCRTEGRRAAAFLAETDPCPRLAPFEKQDWP